MKQLSAQIKDAIVVAEAELLKIDEEFAEVKLRKDVWSKKENLGHLIDSAMNNYQRFVRGAQNTADSFPVYNQDVWVSLQHYNEASWPDLIELFMQLNLHICRLLNIIPPDVLLNPVNIGQNKPVTLEFVIRDYVRHLNHHLEKILNKN